MPVLADVAIAPAILSGNTLISLGLFALVVALETIVVWRLEWGSLRRSFFDMLMANAASTVLGFVFYLGLYSVSYACRSVPYSDGKHVVTSCGWSVPSVLILVLMWLASVIIEGGVLLLLHRHPPRQTWIAVIIANVVSYLLLSPIFFLLFLM